MALKTTTKHVADKQFAKVIQCYVLSAILHIKDFWALTSRTIKITITRAQTTFVRAILITYRTVVFLQTSQWKKWNAKLDTVSNAEPLQNRPHSPHCRRSSSYLSWQSEPVRSWVHDLSLHARFHLKRLFSSPSNDYLVETPQLRHISHLWNSGTSVPPVADLGQIHHNGTGPQYTFTRQIALGSVYSVVSEEQKPAKIYDKICNVWDCAIQWPVINVKAELCA